MDQVRRAAAIAGAGLVGTFSGFALAQQLAIAKSPWAPVAGIGLGLGIFIVTVYTILRSP